MTLLTKRETQRGAAARQILDVLRKAGELDPVLADGLERVSAEREAAAQDWDDLHRRLNDAARDPDLDAVDRVTLQAKLESDRLDLAERVQAARQTVAVAAREAANAVLPAALERWQRTSADLQTKLVEAERLIAEIAVVAWECADLAANERLLAGAVRETASAAVTTPRLRERIQRDKLTLPTRLTDGDYELIERPDYGLFGSEDRPHDAGFWSWFGEAIAGRTGRARRNIDGPRRLNETIQAIASKREVQP
jgi:hypothetical protein